MASQSEIWILEDSELSRDIYHVLLAPDHALRMCMDLAELRSLLQNFEKTPHLLIADLVLPDGNFLNFLSTVWPKELPTRILIASGLYDTDTTQLCLQKGAHDYITKPFDYSLLMRKVEILLKA